MSKIKVVRVIARLNIGGPAIHTILLTRDMDPDRFDSILVTGLEGSNEGSMRDWALEQGVAPIIIPELGREISPVADLKVLLTLYRLFRREKPDIVDTHTAKAGFIGRLAAWLAGVPVIVHTFHGHVFHSYFGPLKTRLFVVIEKLMAYLTDRIITVSRLQREEIIGYGIASPNKIVIIPLGFDLEPFFASDHLRGQIRAELGFDNKVKLVGMVARLTSVKNHGLFLDAAALVHKRCDLAHFLIIGDGELRTELEQRARNLGLEAVVSFLGWRQDMPAIYADLDLVVLTSRNEGTPMTLIEAQASACPVVATGVGGVPDIVLDGKTGYLVPPDDAHRLGETLLVALTGDSGELGQNGRLMVREKFTITRLVHDIEILYEELVKKQSD